MADEPECCVCYRTDGVRVICSGGHHMDDECVAQLTSINEHPTCPLCREPIVNNHIQQEEAEEEEAPAPALPVAVAPVVAAAAAPVDRREIMDLMLEELDLDDPHVVRLLLVTTLLHSHQALMGLIQNSRLGHGRRRRRHDRDGD